VLRGVFLMTQRELDWFYGGGAGAFWPDVWARFTAIVPKQEHGDLIAAYNRRLFSGDLALHLSRMMARGVIARRNTRVHLRGLKTTISPTLVFLNTMVGSKQTSMPYRMCPEQLCRVATI
jgi:hypothetical protein